MTIESISRDELWALIQSESVVVVDSLPEFFYQQTHVPGALNIVEKDVVEKAPRLIPDKSSTVVTYCTNPGCSDSKRVANQLVKLGYHDVRIYRGGLEDWVASGLPVAGSGPSSAF